MAALRSAGLQPICSLGSGCFGSVFKVRRQGVEYAAKAMAKNAALHEHAMLRALKDLPGVVQVHGLFHSESVKPALLLVETLQPMNLSPGDEQEFMDMVVCVLATMVVVHSRGIAHADLKPEHIMKRRHDFVILDWGVAAPSGRFSLRGTPEYSAPEAALQGRGVCISDMWSLAATFTEIWTRHVLFSPAVNAADMSVESPEAGLVRAWFHELGPMPVWLWPHDVPQIAQPRLLDKVPVWARSPLRAMLAYDVQTRSSAEQALHAFADASSKVIRESNSGALTVMPACASASLGSSPSLGEGFSGELCMYGMNNAWQPTDNNIVDDQSENMMYTLKAVEPSYRSKLAKQRVGHLSQVQRKPGDGVAEETDNNIVDDQSDNKMDKLKAVTPSSRSKLAKQGVRHLSKVQQSPGDGMAEEKSEPSERRARAKTEQASLTVLLQDSGVLGYVLAGLGIPLITIA